MEEDGADHIISADTVIDFSLINELGFWLEGCCQPHPNSTHSSNPESDRHPTTFKATANPKSFAAPPSHHQEYQMDEFQVINTTRLWVGSTVPVERRLVQAINCLTDSIRDKEDVLVQIWIPVKRQGRQVLITNNQPFSLTPNCNTLASYRGVSESYQFEAGEDSTMFLGLPGRVFLNRMPEWTPDVRFFRREEYPRVMHALEHDVRGSLALPVFEQGSGICLGVIEVVTTHQKLHFHPELENLCRALQAVDLESSGVQSPYEGRGAVAYQGTQTEIRNVLKFVCNTHKLPLAQVWASCLEQSKGGCRHFDDKYTRCVSIVESACHVADAQVSGFHEACCQQHLLKGEGVPGNAFLTNQPCFSEDITSFSRTQYPLAHHARFFGLCASTAIRLRSGTADFVLEFFFPLNQKGTEDPTAVIQSLSSVMQQHCWSLQVITNEELAQETSDGKLDDGQKRMDPHDKGKGVFVSLVDHQEKPDGEFMVTTSWDKSSMDLHCIPATLENGQPQQDPRPKTTSAVEGGSFSLTIGNLSLGSKANSEKKKKKTNKAIGMEVLKQYFAGSLKEAARNIGVCPTTLKRICRQHGITRWPSRKIKKVSHSLRKLQLVIDSVQGSDGSIQLSSFYNHFPELVSPRNVQVSSPNQPEGTLISPTTLKSPSSSGSHSSSSSYCCSTGVKQSSFPVNGSTNEVGEQTGMLKKARSDAELHEKGKKKMKPLIRSYSHKLFSNHSPTNVSAKPKTSNLQGHHGNFRVKAAFGEKKIRLSLQPHWGFKDLRQEILGRFNIDNGSVVNLKYLDDDAEWVLLTCDDDLEECRHIHTSSNNTTIKLLLNHPNLVGSLGS